MLNRLDNSKESVQGLIVSIQKMAQEQEFSLQSVEHLNSNAQKLGKIISLVGDIANQTNLLALNAAIEAARAGDHGKGFAVVADEVRKLADESTKSVQEISGLITSIQADVQQVVNTIKEQVEFAQKESLKGQQTNATINEMTTSINQVAKSVAQIADLINNQLELMNKTSSQSQEVSAIAQKTSTDTQQVNNLIQEQTKSIDNIKELSAALEQQAKSLSTHINKFNTSKMN
jgi:methyl-accepting chemotaxis protein